MAKTPEVLYQIKTEAPLGAFDSTGKWLFPWSEPVRHPIKPQLAIALITSGGIMTLLPEQGSLTGSWFHWFRTPVWHKPRLETADQQFLAYVPAQTQNDPNQFVGEEGFAEQTQFDKYLYPWSEPVRDKPALLAALQQAFTNDTIPSVVPPGTIGWYAILNEPVRILPHLPKSMQQWQHEAVPLPPGTATLLEGYNWWSEPVMQLPGIRAWLQKELIYHPRILPTPNVTVDIAATEVNTDIALFGVQVYDSTTTTTGGNLANVSIFEIRAIDGGAVAIEG